jgi:hypothetical protein
MGRYYDGDIHGKFWFAVQSSRDAIHFGGREELEDQEAFYYFNTDDLDSINKGIQEVTEFLGENKALLDKFFDEPRGYNDQMIADLLGITGTEEQVKMKTLANLVAYARLGLGEQIRNCVIETGECSFSAEL